MAVGIIKPIQKQEPQGGGNVLGAIGRAVGAIGGTISGAGPLAGAQVGGQVGDTVGGLTAKAPEAPAPQVQQVQTSDNAISRRMGQINQEPATQLADSLSALSQAPPEVRQAYAQPLLGSFMKSQGRA
jgi:hypothetical protein